MKLILTLICLFCLAIVPSFASDYSETVTIFWDWSGPTPEDSGLASADPMANDLEWHLYMRGEGETYDYGNPTVAVPYGQTLSMDAPIVVEGIGGSSVKKYFVLRAFYDNGESGDSNEAFKDFEIPRDSPLNLRFTVSVQSN